MAAVTRKGLHFHTQVTSNSSNTEEYSVNQDATIEHVEVRFYPGQQLDLQLKMIVQDQHGNTKQIVNPTGGKKYIAGDDDFFKFDVSVPIEKNDTIKIKADNVDTSGNDYDYVVNMELDRVGGLERIMSNLTGVFS